MAENLPRNAAVGPDRGGAAIDVSKLDGLKEPASLTRLRRSPAAMLPRHREGQEDRPSSLGLVLNAVAL